MFTGYSVTVKTIVNGMRQQFEPYRGADKDKAMSAFYLAEFRLTEGEVTLWHLTQTAGEPLKRTKRPE